MIFNWEIAKEAYEAEFVIDLIEHESLRIRRCTCITFNSGLADMAAAMISLQLCCVCKKWLSDQDDQLSQYKVCHEEVMTSTMVGVKTEPEPLYA